MDETKTYEEPKPAAEAEEAPAAAEAVPSEGKPEKARKAKREKPEKDDARLKELREKLEKAEQELGETKDQYQRMLAEYANYKRRTEQEKEQLGQFSRGEMLKALLPTVDNLERAAAAPDGEEYKKGVDMVIRQFHEELAGLGLEEIPAESQPFDPELHHAVMREDADGVEPDTVTEVFQKGYRYKGRVLRPAMVTVTYGGDKRPAPEPETDAAEDQAEESAE